MKDVVFDTEGKTVASVHDGDLIDDQGAKVGTLWRDNVYDRNGKFIFHLQTVEGGPTAGRMTQEAVWKLLHPKDGSQPRLG